ncbi:hypothetical protein BDZ45DRAFT_739113 [Acephala macrosclerotiorum]|nr:hypothetical protein BDZ45DRAFT_739113 [Acephala macrosclerotiorum]
MSSTAAPWVSIVLGRKSKCADKDIGGWPDDVKGSSGGPPKALMTQEVKEVVHDFAKAAERSVKVGVDVIEI